jgi:hypothetical protein
MERRMNTQQAAKRFVILMLVGSISLSVQTKGLASESGDIEREVQAHIEAWLHYIGERPYLSTLEDNEPYQAIVDLGMPAIPYIIKNMEKEELWPLSGAVRRITRMHFKMQDTNGLTIDNRRYARNQVDWWNNARKGLPQQFKKLYEQRKKLLKAGPNKQAAETFEEIIKLGIPVLPYLVKEVEKGDRMMIVAIARITNGAVTISTTPSECITWWKTNKEKWLIPFNNKSPKAHVGPDQTVTSGSIVQLDGSASSDEDGDPLAWRWTQVDGIPVTLMDPNSAQPTFLAPDVKTQTELIFQLIVDDAGDILKNYPTPNSKSKPKRVSIIISPKD